MEGGQSREEQLCIYGCTTVQNKFINRQLTDLLEQQMEKITRERRVL
jgi:hypothetical protein